MIECKEGDHIIFMVDGKQEEGKVQSCEKDWDRNINYVIVNNIKIRQEQVIAKQEELFGETNE